MTYRKDCFSKINRFLLNSDYGQLKLKGTAFASTIRYASYKQTDILIFPKYYIKR
jgi:hypothetical protein